MLYYKIVLKLMGNHKKIKEEKNYEKNKQAV